MSNARQNHADVAAELRERPRRLQPSSNGALKWAHYFTTDCRGTTRRG